MGTQPQDGLKLGGEKISVRHGPVPPAEVAGGQRSTGAGDDLGAPSAVADAT
jgi:hypothetical protein